MLSVRRGTVDFCPVSTTGFKVQLSEEDKSQPADQVPVWIRVCPGEDLREGHYNVDRAEVRQNCQSLGRACWQGNPRLMVDIPS